MSYDMRIFNRDGEVIFHSQDPNEVWNGSAYDGQYYVPNGIYLYQCEIKFLNREVQKLLGTVAVLR